VSLTNRRTFLEIPHYYYYYSYDVFIFYYRPKRFESIKCLRNAVVVMDNGFCRSCVAALSLTDENDEKEADEEHAATDECRAHFAAAQRSVARRCRCVQ